MKTAIALAAGCALLLSSGCGSLELGRDPSTQRRIDDTLRQAAAPRDTPRAVPPPPAELPPAVGQALLPPLRSLLPRASAAPAQPRFDLDVTDAPIAQVLHAITADTRYSVLLSPRMQGPGAAGADGARREPLTLHLKDVTVFEALDALRDAYGYEYTVAGTRILVEPPELQTRFYQVNYTLGQRRGVSDLQVVAGAATAATGQGAGGNGTAWSGGGGSGSSGAGGYGSTLASALSTIAKSDFWGEIEDSLRTILSCQIPRVSAATARAGAGTATAAAGSNRADVSYVGEQQAGERARGIDGCSDGRAVNVNPMSGTVLVRGLPKELRMAERLLRAMQLNVERQVIIEAKVVDVQLNQDAQQGINWAALHGNLMRFGVGAAPGRVGAPGTAAVGGTDGTLGTPGAGQIAGGSTVADLLGAQLLGASARNAFSSGLGLTLQGSQFAALISFLQTQGDVHVLSSPRIATLNNQKAVIKVGTEEPFITAIQPGSTSLATSVAVSVPPTLTYQPFFSGISLDVTPQIDERDRVTLHVHALVNSIVEKQKPSSTAAGAATVPLAVSNVNETDSIVKTGDGMMVVIGGLMTDSSSHGRSAVPGLGEVPLAGALFRKGERASSKRELVILIKPTVVKTDADWAEDIAATGRRIRNLREEPGED